MLWEATIPEFTEIIDHLVTTTESHKITIGEFVLDIKYKDKDKDLFGGWGYIYVWKKDKIDIYNGKYYKQDLENILPFVEMVTKAQMSIPNVKEYLSSKQTYCYPNVTEKRIQIELF